MRITIPLSYIDDIFNDIGIFESNSWLLEYLLDEVIDYYRG